MARSVGGVPCAAPPPTFRRALPTAIVSPRASQLMHNHMCCPAAPTAGGRAAAGVPQEAWQQVDTHRPGDRGPHRQRSQEPLGSPGEEAPQRRRRGLPPAAAQQQPAQGQQRPASCAAHHLQGPAHAQLLQLQTAAPGPVRGRLDAAAAGGRSSWDGCSSCCGGGGWSAAAAAGPEWLHPAAAR